MIRIIIALIVGLTGLTWSQLENGVIEIIRSANAAQQSLVLEDPYDLLLPVIDLETPMPKATGNLGMIDFGALTKNYPVVAPQYTQELGLPGITFIFGHRQWGPKPMVFAYLDVVKLGDSVTIKGKNGTLTYVVEEIMVLSPPSSGIWPEIVNYDTRLKQEGKTGVALITCTPYGTDKLRLIVIATTSLK